MNDNIERRRYVITRSHTHFPIPVFETVLPNGLTVITTEQPSSFVRVGIVFAAGSLDDGEYPGTAHFLEHLLYEGAARDGVHPKLRRLYRTGIEGNGEVGRSSTEYWIDGDVENLGEILEALFSIVCTFECTATHVDRERPVILREMDQTDDAEQRLLLWEYRTFFPHAPALHYPNDGTRESVEGITVEALRDFFERFYLFDNAVLIVTGGASHAAILEVCDRLLARFEARTPRPQRALIKPQFCRVRYETQESPSTLTLSFSSAENREEDFLLGLVYDFLVHDPFGILHMRLRRRERLVYDVADGVSDWPKPYRYFEIDSPPSRFSYVERVVFESIERFIAGEWDGDLWESVLADKRRAFRMRGEESREKWYELLRDDWLHGNDLGFDARELLVKVTREHLASLAGQYLTRDCYGCLSVVRV